jgi:hypothetical protein
VALPENTTSRTVKTMCPKCGELIPVPPSPSRHPQESVLADLQHGRAGAGLREQLAEAMATLRSLGLLVLGLGLVALLLSLGFCISDYIPFLSLPVAGVGLLLGLYGLGRALKRGERGVLYVLGGLAACALALGSFFLRPSSPNTTDGIPTGGSSVLEQRQKIEKEPR